MKNLFNIIVFLAITFILFCYVWAVYTQLDLLSRREILIKEVENLQQQVEYLKTHHQAIADEIVESIAKDEKLLQLIHDLALKTADHKIWMLLTFFSVSFLLYLTVSLKLFGGGGSIERCSFTEPNNSFFIFDKFKAQQDSLFLKEVSKNNVDLNFVRENVVQSLVELQNDYLDLLVVKMNDLTNLSELIESAQLAGFIY